MSISAELVVNFMLILGRIGTTYAAVTTWLQNYLPERHLHITRRHCF